MSIGKRAESARICTKGQCVVRFAGSQVGPAAPAGQDRSSFYAYGAVFAEVAVDAQLGLVRLRRMLGVYDAGRIVPLRHNAFSFFPFNVETHYLLAMHLEGGPYEGMYLCQLMHLSLMVLVVLLPQHPAANVAAPSLAPVEVPQEAPV